MPEDKLRQLFDAWILTTNAPTFFQAYQAGFTAGAVAMRFRAQKLAQTKTGNDLINAIGELHDIPEE